MWGKNTQDEQKMDSNEDTPSSCAGIASAQASTSRNFWKETEILTMLQVFQEESILDLFDGKRYKNNEIYNLVERKMREKGINSKTSLQIKNKWKALKSLYNTCIKNNLKSGAERMECEYFFLLDEILGTRPASALKGYDVEVDYGISTDEISQLLSETEKEDEGGQKTTGKTKKFYKSTKTVRKSDEELIRQQKDLLADFFDRQRELDDRAAKARSDDLKQILTTFTNTIQALMQPPMIYGGMPQYVVPPPFQQQAAGPSGLNSSSNLSKRSLLIPSSDDEEDDEGEGNKKRKK